MKSWIVAKLRWRLNLVTFYTYYQLIKLSLKLYAKPISKKHCVYVMVEMQNPGPQVGRFRCINWTMLPLCDGFGVLSELATKQNKVNLSMVPRVPKALH